MNYAYTTVEYMYTKIQGYREIFLKWGMPTLQLSVQIFIIQHSINLNSNYLSSNNTPPHIHHNILFTFSYFSFLHLLFSSFHRYIFFSVSLELFIRNKKSKWRDSWTKMKRLNGMLLLQIHRKLWNQNIEKKICIFYNNAYLIF